VKDESEYPSQHHKEHQKQHWKGDEVYIFSKKPVAHVEETHTTPSKDIETQHAYRVVESEAHKDRKNNITVIIQAPRDQEQEQQDEWVNRSRRRFNTLSEE